LQPGIELVRDAPVSLQAQLVSRLRELILSGGLAPGTRMLASRELSRQLGISRNTVVLSYDRLIAEGYLEAHGPAGTFVTSSLPESSMGIGTSDRQAVAIDRSRPSTRPLSRRFAAPILHERPKERIPFDFRIGRPDARSFPLKRWRRLLDEKLAKAGKALTEYGNPAGLYELRKALVDHLREARGIEADPEQVIVVGGCEEGLNVVARMLCPSDTRVYVETPCYQGVAFVFASYGAAVKPVPIDDEGLCLDGLPDKGVGLVCVTPSHQFPIGVTMSLNRRLRLLDWARRNGAYVVEDDYDSDFRYTGSPLMALAALDREGCVIYLGTFSKSIGAGLRIGYLVVPPELIGPARETKALINLGNPWLEQAVLAEFIASGSFAQHLRRVRKTYLQRRDALISNLRDNFGDVELLGEEGGMHLTWMLPERGPSARVVQNECLSRDVGVYTIDDGPAFDFGKYRRRDQALFLGYPCLNEDEIGVAIRRLAEQVPSPNLA
jgi:GntR family transcriptional regulator/MocR family aminotransferase